MTPAHQAFYDAVILLSSLKDLQDTGRDAKLLDELWNLAWNDAINKGKLWLAESQNQ